MTKASSSSILTVCALTVFYIFSPADAIPAVCERSNIGTAVDCACFLYQPLYESDPTWSGVENLCLRELSGNIQAGNSSCETAPFRVSPSSSTRVQLVSIRAADRYFRVVQRSCEKVTLAEEEYRKADEELARADNAVDARRAKFDKRFAKQKQRHARHSISFARQRGSSDVKSAKGKERFDRLLAKFFPRRRKLDAEFAKQSERIRKESVTFQLQQRYLDAQDHGSFSLDSSSKAVSPSNVNHQYKVVSKGISSYLGTMRPVPRLRILPTVRLQTRKVMKRFCIVATIYKRIPPYQGQQICCRT